MHAVNKTAVDPASNHGMPCCLMKSAIHFMWRTRFVSCHCLHLPNLDQTLETGFPIKIDRWPSFPPTNDTHRGAHVCHLAWMPSERYQGTTFANPKSCSSIQAAKCASGSALLQAAGARAPDHAEQKIKLVLWWDVMNFSDDTPSVLCCKMTFLLEVQLELRQMPK